MIDDRLDKQTPRTEHITLTCRNHTSLRWSTKNISHRSLFFSGEHLDAPITVQERVWTDPDDEHPMGTLTDEMRDVEITFKQPANMPEPMHLLRAYLNGKNPYDTRLDIEDENQRIRTWEDLVEYVEYIEHTRKRFAFECSCPARDLIYLHTVAGQYISRLFHGPECADEGGCGHESCRAALADRSLVAE